MLEKKTRKRSFNNLFLVGLPYCGFKNEMMDFIIEYLVNIYYVVI